MKKDDRWLKPLTGFFKKYQNTLIAPEATVIEHFIEIIDDIFSIKLNKNQVRYNPPTQTISVTVSGPLKTEIQLRKQEILTHLKARLGQKNTPTSIL